MSSAQRLPFAGSQQLRPQIGPTPTGPIAQRQPIPQGQGPNGQPWQMNPQLRRVDSQSNVIPNTGQPPRQGIQQQVRPPSTAGGTTSPTGQGSAGIRQQGNYPRIGSAGGQPTRPSNNTFGNQPPIQVMRSFPRPGQGGQPQFRQPFPQPNYQQQHQGITQQMAMPNSQRPLGPQGPTQVSSPMSKTYSHDDDDSDVVFGQAVSPLKATSNTSNNIKDINDIDEEERADTGEKQGVHIETNQPSNGFSENISNSTSLINSQKISSETNGHTSEPENSAKNNRSSKEEAFNKNIKGDNDSGVDESTQEKDRNEPISPSSTANIPIKPTSGISRPPSTTPSNKSRSASRSRLAIKTPEPETAKKIPMNKIQVGNAPSPNLKAVRSKIGSLDNATYKPGGGKVKIETKKIEIKAAPRIEAKNEKYTPRGGDKKIVSTKLQWNAKSKIGSLENANHKPGGGDKKIETIKADFKDKAQPKVGSKDIAKYVPGGGDIKKDDAPKDIQTHKLEIKAQSKIGSLDNVKHKPGGGDKQIFDDKEYLKNIEHPVAPTSSSQTATPSSLTTSTIGADENLNQQHQTASAINQN